MNIQIVTDATSEVLDIDSVKNYLKVDFSTDDNLITSLIKSARNFVENYCQMALLPQAWKCEIDSFPLQDGSVLIPKHPIRSVTGISFFNSDGIVESLSSEKYVSSSLGLYSRIGLSDGSSWPETSLQIGSVIIYFSIGYNDAESVPEDIKSAMLLLIGHLYEKREDTIRKLPTQVEFLLDKYRLFSVA